MKYIFILTLVFFSLADTFGQQVSEVLSKQGKEIDLEIRAARSKGGKVTVEVKVRNNMLRPIFLCTDPRDVNGSEGYFVSFDETNSTFKLESRLFAPDGRSPYTDQSGVYLTRLESNEVYSKTLVLEGQVIETVPPAKSNFDKRIFPVRSLKNVQVSLGYFPEDDGILKLLEHKKFGPFVTGVEVLFSGPNRGKRLYESQRIVSDLRKVN